MLVLLVLVLLAASSGSTVPECTVAFKHLKTDDDDGRRDKAEVRTPISQGTTEALRADGIVALDKTALRKDQHGLPLRPNNPTNITVFHVVDTSFQKRSGAEREWPVNMNTADLGGDMYFDLGWGQLEVLECKKPLNFSRSRLVKVNCQQNAEVWDRKKLAIAQLTLEVDGNFSKFIGCDAMGPNQSMDCHCGGGGNESYKHNARCAAGVGRRNPGPPNLGFENASLPQSLGHSKNAFCQLQVGRQVCTHARVGQTVITNHM